MIKMKNMKNKIKLDKVNFKRNNFCGKIMNL